MDSLLNSFCDRLEELLETRHISKTELAQKMGIKKQTLNGYLNKTRIPKAEVLIELSKILNVSIDFLLTGSDRSTQNVYRPTNEESTILTMYRKLSPESQTKVKGYLEISCFDCNFPSHLADSATMYSFSPKGTHIPILGHVAAGAPIEAIENELAIIETNLPNVQYALYASGDSMEPTIHDGDIIYIHTTPEIENGEIGVFKIDDEVTCKIYHKYSDRIELRSINPEYSPLIYFKDSLNSFQTLGKVVLTDAQKRNFNL